MKWGFCLFALLLGGFSTSARAQWLPPEQWEEPTVIDMSHPPPPSQQEPTDSYVIPAEVYPEPLYHHQVEDLAARVEAATVPVRATFERDPLLFPSTFEVVGAATLVQKSDGGMVFITAYALVNGARQVVFDLPDGPVTAHVRSDARYGLAILDPQEALDQAVTPLRLSEAGAQAREEAISTQPGTVGATLGAGEDRYGFYQINTLGVILGYPLVNRDGEILGIGSHYYPLNPAFSLSVPSAAVQEFLSDPPVE